MTSQGICPKCGTVIGGFGPVGLCPKCLLLSGLEAEAGSGETSGEPVLHGPVDSRRPHLRYFGDYELLEEVASGGMGIVYKARQNSLNRVVAVKLLLFGKFSHPEFVLRFRAEAAAAAALQHRNIVAIHEVGEHEGQPYFSMDYVDGTNLADLVREQALPAKQAALYLKLIAEAIHFAHGKGVLHRDLKPSNVLLDQFDQPRITDFGLAKQLNDGSDLTITGQALGSPGYMPPEQAIGKRAAMGPASDVYSMGAILFHLLTGRPPFVSESMTETLQQVLGAEPVSPRLLNPSVPRDLETICLKCLEKDPARRYTTARDLGEELDRFLRDEPIRARPVGPAHRAWRWARRHPAIAALGSAVLLMLAAVALTSTIAALRIARAEQGRVEKLRESYLAQAQARRRTAEAGHRFHALAAVREAARLNPPAALVPQLRSEAMAALAMRDVRTAREWRINPAERSQTWSFNRGLDLYARLTDTGAEQLVSLHRVADDTVLARLAIGNPRAIGISALTEDGYLVAVEETGVRHRVYDLKQGGLATTNEIRAPFVEFVGGTNLLASFTPQGAITLWDVNTGLIVRTIEVPPTTVSIAFSPDGSRIALNLGRQVLVRDTATERAISSITVAASAFRVAWGGDNTRLVARCSDKQAVLWRAETGEEVKIFSGAAGGILAAALHSGERLVLTSELDRTVRLWDLVRSQTILTLPGGGLEIRFSSDGRRFGPVLLGDRCTIYEIVPPAGYRRLAPDIPETRYGELDWSPEGRLLALGTPGRVRLWDVDAQAQLGTLIVPELSERALGWWKVGRTRPVFFDDAGTLWAEGGEELVQWPMRFGAAASAREVQIGPSRFSPFDALSNRWSRVPGQWLARTLPQASTNGVIFARMSPNGRQLVVLSSSAAQVCDQETGVTVTNIPVQGARAAQFSPDGRWLVLAGGRYDIWDPAKLRRVTSIDSEAEEPTGAWAEFSPDGRILALTRDGRQIDLRSVGSWTSIAALEAPDGIRVEQIRFSRDGRRLAASGRDGSVQVWDLRAMAGELTAIGLDWPLPMGRGAEAGEADFSSLRLKVIPAVPARDPAASRQLVDLSAHYNARLDQGWFHQRWTLAKLQTGVQSLGGVNFDVRGAVQLSPGYVRPPASGFPTEVKGIEIRQRLTRIHFLHGCIDRVAPGTAVARYVVHYGHGERVEIPVVYGQEVRDTVFNPDSPTEAANASIVWRGTSDTTPNSRVSLRLFHFVWTNPRTTEVQQLDFLSAGSASAPFLVAITTE
jgi:eukaryotic-like serine/threonine-protein kinase